MKTTRLLRWLSLLGFLLLLAPFYDSCDGDYFLKKAPKEGVVIEKSFSEKIYDVVVDDESLNGFEIASMTIVGFKNGIFEDLKEEMLEFFQKKDWYENLGFFVSILFDLIILISFTMIVLSFTKSTGALNKLALINSILILVTLFYILFFESSFEYFRQIKWGYYGFIITNLLIFYYSKPNKIKT